MMASQSDQPNWMSEGQPEEYTNQTSPPRGYVAPGPGFNGNSSSSQSSNSFYIKMAVKVVLIGMSVMMLANGDSIRCNIFSL
jgi:hypothetical protein